MAGLLGIGRDRKMEALNAAAEVIEIAHEALLNTPSMAIAPYVLILHGTPQGHHASFIGEPLEEGRIRDDHALSPGVPEDATGDRSHVRRTGRRRRGAARCVGD